MTTTTTTAILPGEGIGDSIRLGTLLFQLISALTTANYKLQINYSDSPADYSSLPIQVDLIEYDIRLTFSQQILELIEVDLNDKVLEKPLLLTYQGLGLTEIDTYDVGLVTELLDSSMLVEVESPAKLHRATLKQIYNKIFGPTYPGDLVHQGNGYILQYPGIAFRFDVHLVVPKLARQNKMDSEKLLLILLNHDKDVYCKGVAIYLKQGTWDNIKLLAPKAVVCKVALDSGVVEMTVRDKVVAITIGVTTAQQVEEMLGPPDDYFNKYDSRMQIHGSARPGPIQKFHNYFDFGVDILYQIGHGEAVVHKIVLHNGGITELLAFGRWNGCQWQITSTHLDEPLTLSMLYDDLPAAIKKNPPVFLDRSELEFVDRDIDIVEVVPTSGVFERDGPDQESTNAKMKTWGQLKLYGYHRCILEVMEASGCVLAVTIF